MRTTLRFLLAAFLVGAIPATLEARIKLVALPDRDVTVVRLDNPSATLVEEERTLTLQKGVNHVDFSWKGVSIDPDSIRLTVLGHPTDVKLLNVSFPPNEAALVWELGSSGPFQEKVRISYLLSAIDRLVTYTGTAEQDESKLGIQSHVVLRNFSGESFGVAKVQLDYGEAFERSIQNEETKRVLFLAKENIPIEKTFTWDDQQMVWDPEKAAANVGIPVYYAILNAKESGLGENGLWGGKARVYQKDGHDSTIFLGEDNLGFTPVGDRARIRIGDSRDIVVTQKKQKEEQINVRRNNRRAIVLYDTDEIVEAKIENFKEKPAVLILTEHIPGQWEMAESSHKFEKKDFQTLEFRLELKPKEKVTLLLHYHRRNVR
jgi:hypothetical protein